MTKSINGRNIKFSQNDNIIKLSKNQDSKLKDEMTKVFKETKRLDISKFERLVKQEQEFN